MPPRRNNNIYDVYERIMARMEERLYQFVDQFANLMNDMMNPRGRGDRNGQISKGEESENPFFEGDGSSLFVKREEWEDDGVANDDYKEGPIFDDDPYEKEILPDALPPLCDIQHHIDLEPSSQLPNMSHYRLCHGEHEELCRHVEGFVSNGHIRKIMSTCAQLRGPLDLLSLYVFGSVPKKVQDFVKGLPYHNDLSNDDLVGNSRTNFEEPYLFKVCSDGMIRRCVSGSETRTILDQCHHGPTGGHYGPNVTAKKKLKLYQPMMPELLSLSQRNYSAISECPNALISDRGTHIYNKIMEKTMKRYEVNHRFSTSYHPQTSGQVENMNRALKRILEKTVKDNPAIWSRKLDDALWTFRTGYKTPTETTPYKLIYGKNYHLLFEIEHRAYWDLKNSNPDLIAAGEK
uniref:Integrase catalytic domain-containing protein n=1 Tax=Tanacetum cinerariifolium TaxID=118510 RepID=A0A699GMD8_TANCI|nr:hypothetical protein [Tanacetum cinerariifolium]